MSICATLYGSIARLFDTLSHRLHTADASDFGFVALAVIVTLWYVTHCVLD